MAPEDFRYHPGPTWTILDGDNEYTDEQNLIESTLIEANDIYGLPVNYYILDFDNDEADTLYGEDQNEKFTGPYSTKVSFKPYEEVHLVDAFGIINNESLENINMPKFTFSRDISSTINPKAGDVIHFIYNNIYYEITHVHDEQDIFLTKSLSYNFAAKIYRRTNVDTAVNVDILTTSEPLSAWGDNDFIETAANEVDDLSDLPNFSDLYGIGEE